MGIRTHRAIAAAHELPKPPTLDKDDPRRNAEHQRYEHCPHPRVNKRQVVHVHAVKTKHDCWNSQYERDDGQALHGVVHAVIDDKLDGKSIIKEIYIKNKIYNIVVK